MTQQSNVEVNGQLLTEFRQQGRWFGRQLNGNLNCWQLRRSVFAAASNYEEDTERYDLSSFIADGDTSITVETFNTSRDDNIFLAAFYVSGRAGFNALRLRRWTIPLIPILQYPASSKRMDAGRTGGLGLVQRRRAANA